MASFSLLGDLTPELFHDVGEFLPPDSLAALALTCKDAFNLVGRKAIANVRTAGEEERGRLALLLERDLPDHVTIGTMLFGGAKTWLPRLEFDDNTGTYIFGPHFPGGEYFFWAGRFGYRIRFAHVALALKYAALGGRNGLPVDKFRHNIVITYRDESRALGWASERSTKNRTIGFNVEARIVGGRLLLKAIYQITYDECQRASFPCLYGLGLELCNHVAANAVLSSGMSPERDNGLTVISLRRDFTGSDQDPEERDSTPDTIRRLQCSFCHTEYTVALSDSDAGPAILITVYHDLGNGKRSGSPFWDPSNPEWAAFAGMSDPYNPELCVLPMGSIKTAYETGVAYSASNCE